MDSESRLAQVTESNLKIDKIRVGDYLINYVTAGSGKPLLLIHGGNIGWGQWYPNIGPLSKHFKVYAIDLPGAGRSSRIDYDDLDLERDFLGVTREFINITGIGDAHIIGSSVGGWIALRLALRGVPFGKIVLTDSLGFTDYMRFSDRILGIRVLPKALVKTILRPYRENRNIERFLRSVFYDKKTPLAPQFIDYFYETMRTSHNLLLISRLSSIWGVRREFVMNNELRDVKNQTLIIWGEHDALMPVERSQTAFSLMPNCRTKIIKAAGHIPSIEKSSEFNDAVINFLDS